MSIKKWFCFVTQNISVYACCSTDFHRSPNVSVDTFTYYPSLLSVFFCMHSNLWIRSGDWFRKLNYHGIVSYICCISCICRKMCREEKKKLCKFSCQKCGALLWTLMIDKSINYFGLQVAGAAKSKKSTTFNMEIFFFFTLTAGCRVPIVHATKKVQQMGAIGQSALIG